MVGGLFYLASVGWSGVWFVGLGFYFSLCLGVDSWCSPGGWRGFVSGCGLGVGVVFGVGR